MTIYDHVGMPFSTGDGIAHRLLYDHRGRIVATVSQQALEYGHAAVREARRFGELEDARTSINSPDPQRHIASLPSEIYNQLWREGRAPTQDGREFLKWLDQWENHIWKSWKGRVS